MFKRIETSAPAQLQGAKTRLHGDYHLGQVLVAHHDFIITDFEGEPARSLAERRAKHSALKDVAGMLRSFNYALYTALGQASVERPDTLPLHEQGGRDWERETHRVFLDAYRKAARDPGLDVSRKEVQRLLDLFVFEKAFYELGYEINNRPDWVRIPVRGILELLDSAGYY